MKKVVLKGIAKDVLSIICDQPGLTGGEIFIEYKKKNPKTTRSRNELAKRISDLREYGAVKPHGKTLCPLTGKNVNKWYITGKQPTKKETSKEGSQITLSVSEDSSTNVSYVTTDDLENAADFIEKISKFVPFKSFREKLNKYVVAIRSSY